MTTHLDTSNAIIEGISNDALFAVIFFTILLAIIVYYNMITPSQIIHPTQLDHVQATRERVLDGRSEDNHVSNTRRRTDDRCPICLDQLRFAVETNCGHTFCCTCITSYWEHGQWLAAMNCPVCRQEVRVLLSVFTHEEDVSNEEPALRGKLREYNRRFSGEPRPIWDYILDFPVIVRHMIRNFFTVSGLVVMLRLRIVLYLLLVLIYIISPFDIIPEAVTGLLGYLDDIAIAGVIVLYLTILFRQSLANDV